MAYRQILCAGLALGLGLLTLVAYGGGGPIAIDDNSSDNSPSKIVLTAPTDIGG